MADYTFNSEALYDAVADQVVENATGGKLVSVLNGSPLPIYDLNSNPISEITSNANGQTIMFKADVYRGLVQFGSVAVGVVAIEVADFAVNAQGAVDIANAASTQAANTQSALDAHIAGGETGGTGVTDHGALTGLTDDDHPQYLTQARGDGFYYPKAVADANLAAGLASNATADRNRANHTGTQPISSVVGLQAALDAQIGISRQMPGAAMVLTWDATSSSYKDVNGATVGSRPRTDIAIIFSGGGTTDVPVWGHMIYDFHVSDATIPTGGGGGGGSFDPTQYYTKTQVDALVTGSAVTRWLGLYAGTGASAKYRQALLDEAALGNKHAVMVDPGATLDAGATPFTLPTGFHTYGSPGSEDEFGYNCTINVAASGGTNVFRMASGSKGQKFTGLCFKAGFATRIFEDSPMDASGAYWTYVTMRDVSVNGCASIYQGPHLGTRWSGACNFNNMAGFREPLYINGSDNNFFTDGLFMEMGGVTTGTATYSQRAQTAAMIRLGTCSKTSIGPIYITGSPMTPFRLDGGEGGINFHDPIIEGRPAPGGGPNFLWCAGELARLTGGAAHFRSRWWGFAMRSPADTGRTPSGFIHVTGGDHVIDGGTMQPYAAANYPSYVRADGATMPSGRFPVFVYITGGHARVTNITRGTNLGATKPIVLCSNTNLVDVDSSVDLRVIGVTSGPTIDPAL